MDGAGGAHRGGSATKGVGAVLVCLYRFRRGGRRRGGEHLTSIFEGGALVGGEDVAGVALQVAAEAFLDS